jgi:hypothetical protein
LSVENGRDERRAVLFSASSALVDRGEPDECVALAFVEEPAQFLAPLTSFLQAH